MQTCESIFPKLYLQVIQKYEPKMQILECMYIRQLCDLLEGLIPSGEEAKDIKVPHLQRIIIFAHMWSLGALLELEDRKKLEDWMKENVSNLPLPPASGDDTIFEYMVGETGDWEHWSGLVPEYVYPSDSVPEYTGILVPNVDNVRSDYLIGTISKQGKAVLLIGEQVGRLSLQFSWSCLLFLYIVVFFFYSDQFVSYWIINFDHWSVFILG